MIHTIEAVGSYIAGMFSIWLVMQHQIKKQVATLKHEQEMRASCEREITLLRAIIDVMAPEQKGEIGKGYEPGSYCVKPVAHMYEPEEEDTHTENEH